MLEWDNVVICFVYLGYIIVIANIVDWFVCLNFSLVVIVVV